MNGFDRLAWYCSWMAPVGWTVAALAFLLSLLETTIPVAESALPLAAVVAASLALVAHTILGYHVLKAGAFSEGARKVLWRDYLLVMGYRRWRELMRGRNR